MVSEVRVKSRIAVDTPAYGLTARPGLGLLSSEQLYALLATVHEIRGRRSGGVIDKREGPEQRNTLSGLLSIPVGTAGFEPATP
jgi:hypothetical protein